MKKRLSPERKFFVAWHCRLVHDPLDRKGVLEVFRAQRQRSQGGLDGGRDLSHRLSVSNRHLEGTNIK
jgi:hypothetical protein